MGQKVNPHGLRVGVIKDWDSKWYAEKDFADYLVEDNKIRTFLKKKLYSAGVSKIEIDSTVFDNEVTFGKILTAVDKIHSNPNYRIEKRDIAVLFYILLLGTYVMVGKFKGQTDFSFYPMIKSAPFTVYSISIFSCYFLLCVTPVIIELWEVRRWKYLRSKI